MLDWLQGYPDLPFAPTYLNELITGKQLTLRERYWIDANPTTTNLFTFQARSDEICDRPLYLPLEMMLNSNRIDRLQGGSVVQAWASYSLTPTPSQIDWGWFMTSQFILSNRSFDTENRSRVYINAFPEKPQAFFKWMLDLEDQRSSTFEMINQPKP